MRLAHKAEVGHSSYTGVIRFSLKEVSLLVGLSRNCKISVPTSQAKKKVSSFKQQIVEAGRVLPKIERFIKLKLCPSV